MGQSKRLYCSDRCKVEALRAGKTNLLSDEGIPVGESPLPAIGTKQVPKHALSSTRITTDKSSNIDLKIRRIELEHAYWLKQVELDEAERVRAHEQALTRMRADESSREAKLQALTQQVNEFQQKAILPLDEWTHFPVGIRRRY